MRLSPLRDNPATPINTSTPHLQEQDNDLNATPPTPPPESPATPEQLVAVAAIMDCLSALCDCEGGIPQRGITMDAMSKLLRRQLQQVPAFEFEEHAPLSMLKPVSDPSIYDLGLPNWEALLTGFRLDPSQSPPGPPTLDMDASERRYLQDRGTPVIQASFNIDSILFSPSHLRVF